MEAQELATIIAGHLPYVPNDQQRLVIGALSRFCSPQAPDDSVFLLNGYAGTGKTSICGALVKSLRLIGMQAELLAPTGRAAKVFSAYAGAPAYTIHRRIYRHVAFGDMTSTARSVLENKHSNTLFIVDEASMITADDSSGQNLLEDLIHYVYTGVNCRLILLGDTAQLPPVGCQTSPAMQPDVLRSYGLRVTKATLTATARQGALSGILHNATWLRRAMRQDPIPAPVITTDGYADVKLIEGADMAEELYSAYNHDGVDDTIVITRSNQRAAAFNKEIRTEVLYLEEEIASGELILISKNNYFWAQKIKQLDFIANGDVAVVDRVIGTETRYGMRFADVRLTLTASQSANREADDADSSISFEAKIMLDSLWCDTANMPTDRINQLYYDIMQDPTLFDNTVPMDARLKALKTNPYWNALQVKYAYAVTCHKSQGGQWSNVFVDMAYIAPEAMGLEFYRWLYTAVTRAKSRLYILQ